MPPPLVAPLLDRVLLLTATVPPALEMPPPLAAALPDTGQPLPVSVPRLRMPPPEPLLIVRPARVTVTPWAASKTREELFPLMVRWPAPGPWIVRVLVRSSSPLVRVIVGGVVVVDVAFFP